MAGITDKAVRALIAKAQREARVLTQADGTVPGLTLTASKAGVGAWVLRYYVAGKRREVTIGQYPAWSAAEAREKARELRRAVDGGADVALQKQMTKVDAGKQTTVDQLAAAYFERAEKDLHPHTLKQRRSVHARFVSPIIGNFPAPAVTSAHVVDVVRKSRAAGQTIPRIALLHVTQLFHHAVGNAICPANPCRDVRETAVVGKPDAPKQRIALTETELVAFLGAMEAIPRPYALAIRLMLLTGVRVGTLTEARIAEFDLGAAGLWRIPHERRKNRRYTAGPFIMPLEPTAVTWVSEMARIADRSDYLLPVEARRHADGRNPLSKRGTLGDWLDRMPGCGTEWRRITPHDLRATCKSWLSELRIDYETRQRYLDHALTGMDAIYDKSEQLDRLRQAQRTWLAFLERCER